MWAKEGVQSERTPSDAKPSSIELRVPAGAIFHCRLKWKKATSTDTTRHEKMRNEEEEEEEGEITKHLFEIINTSPNESRSGTRGGGGGGVVTRWTVGRFFGLRRKGPKDTRAVQEVWHADCRTILKPPLI